jgi:polyhydroxybutyrate depolymerase
MKTINTLFYLLLFFGFFNKIHAQCNDIELIIETETGEWAEEMAWNLFDESNTLIGLFQGMDGSDYTDFSNSFCLEPGCYYIEALDSWGDGWNGGEISLSYENNNSTYSLTGNTYLGYEEFELGINTDDCEIIIYGCTDNNANNYNQYATIDNGSCVMSLEFYVSGDKNPREYIFYKPESAGSKAPLIFVSHGYGGSANGIMNYTSFIDLANEQGFAVCFPQGQYDGNTAYWNVGYNFTPNNASDDIQFFVELAAYLQDTYDLSPEKTFSSGMSNGAEISYLLACEASETFAAIAGVAGTMFNGIINNCSATQNVSIMEIHGTEDNVTYYDGDLNDTFWGPYPGQEEVIDFWVQNNNCQMLESGYLPNNATNDGSEVFVKKYSSSTTNTHIWFYKIEGGGHDWPGSNGNMDIDSAEEIWKFFKHCMNESNLEITENNINPAEIKFSIDLMGRKTNAESSGFTIDILEDGSAKKNIRINK